MYRCSLEDAHCHHQMYHGKQYKQEAPTRADRLVARLYSDSLVRPIVQSPLHNGLMFSLTSFGLPQSVVVGDRPLGEARAVEWVHLIPWPKSPFHHFILWREPFFSAVTSLARLESESEPTSWRQKKISCRPLSCQELKGWFLPIMD